VIALVQLPRGKHYPSDVVAGAVVGVVAEAIVDRAAVWLSQRLSSASQNLSPRAQQLEP
jgi:membrane-associated phospholipid phosphatase